MRESKLGFTLIELLVVVLIIGVLTAIALPMYNKAVLRSRFSALMPIANAMADSNEAYYLEHGNYATDPQDLPVQGQLEYPTGTTLEFGQNMTYAYVLASNPDARNNYIVYQKHSANYPGEIHCEALTGDELAEAICASLGNGNGIGTTLTDGYTTYVIEGMGAGLPPGADDGTMNCTKANERGLACSVSEDGQSKKICTIDGVCRTKTLHEDGSYTSITCKANTERVCIYSWFSADYDANGNMTRERYCNEVDSEGNCSVYSTSHNTDYVFDENGQRISTRNCRTVASDGTCSVYGSIYDNTYDANGNMIRTLYCGNGNSQGSCDGEYQSGWYYEFDGSGNGTRQRYCSSVASDGSCGSYSVYQNFDYVYDDDGNKISSRSCKKTYSNGDCKTYNYGYDYTYDADGKVASQRKCANLSTSGVCSEYDTQENYNYAYDSNGHKTRELACTVDSSGNCTGYTTGTYYEYDSNGNTISRRNCAVVASDGSCSTYNTSGNYDYTYDSNGNAIVTRQCNTVAADGSCSVYNNNVTYNSYDADGNKTSSRTCGDVAADGSCNLYSDRSDVYTYDDNGVEVSHSSCSVSRIDATTGECINYDSLSVYNH